MGAAGRFIPSDCACGVCSGGEKEKITIWGVSIVKENEINLRLCEIVNISVKVILLFKMI